MKQNGEHRIPQTIDPTQDRAPVPSVMPAPTPEEEAVIQALLQGKLPPTNEFAAYFVNRAREEMQKAGRAGQELQMLKMRMQQLEADGMRAAGAADGYIQDLRRFIKMAPMKPPEAPAPSQNAS